MVTSQHQANQCCHLVHRVWQISCRSGPRVRSLEGVNHPHFSSRVMRRPSPATKGFPRSISIIMQPILHTSRESPYAVAPRIASGDLYHKVTTYRPSSGHHREGVFTSMANGPVGIPTSLARPKSAIFMAVQSSLSSMLWGFRSLWSIYTDINRSMLQ